MKLFAYCGLVISVLWLNSATAQERTVTIGGNSSSLYFGPVQHFDINSQPITSFFTTSDGFTDRFPTNQVIGNSAFFSGELRTNDVDSYGADLATYSQSAGWTEYGSISAFLPTTDADGNGLPDICQTNRAVNLTGFQARSGTFHADSPFPRTDAFQLALSRASNQIAGTYTIKFSSEPVQASGVFQALNISGSISSYSRIDGTISFRFAITDPPILGSGQSRIVTGSTTYNANNPNQLVLPQFTVSGGGASYTFVGGCTLNRTGSRYVGKASLNDGVPETSWRDFGEWLIEINDPNDWDNNGIPDLTDTIPNPPIIITPPQSKTAVLTSNVSFTVSASGSQPLKYQWQEHGTNLPWATLGAMTLTNAQLADSGEFRAIVSNGGGSATSQVAILTVIFPPNITDQPQDQSVLAGESAQFGVAANGSDPLFYQWRRQGTNLPGETSPILYIPNAQPSKEGLYSVIVSNAAGVALSSDASLIVNVPPGITTQPRSLSAPANVAVQMQVVATGSVLTYRWTRNGTNVPGGGLPTLTLNNVRPESGGIFNVTVSNRVGVAVSSNAVLYVGWPLALTNLIRRADGTSQMDVIGRGSTSYVFQSSFNLSNWVSLSTNNASNGLLSFTNPPLTPVPNRQFYRVKVN